MKAATRLRGALAAAALVGCPHPVPAPRSPPGPSCHDLVQQATWSVAERAGRGWPLPPPDPRLASATHRCEGREGERQLLAAACVTTTCRALTTTPLGANSAAGGWCLDVSTALPVIEYWLSETGSNANDPGRPGTTGRNPTLVRTECRLFAVDPGGG